MTEYVTISQGKKEKTGSIIVECVSVGQITPGKSKGGKSYQKQVVVVKDHSGTQEITLWNDDIGRLDADNFYKIDTPNWTVYNETIQLGLGRLGQISPINKDDLIPVSAGGITGHYIPNISTTLPLPIDENIEGRSYEEAVVMLQIERGIKTAFEKYGIDTNVSHVGMFVKEIYREIKKQKG